MAQRSTPLPRHPWGQSWLESALCTSLSYVPSKLPTFSGKGQNSSQNPIPAPTLCDQTQISMTKALGVPMPICNTAIKIWGQLLSHLYVCF